MFKKIGLLVLILLLFACRKGTDATRFEEQGKPAYGDTLIISSIGEASNLIPILASDSASHDIASYIYNGLVKYDKDLHIVGDLAESWDFSPDRLSITFHLRKNVRWHDGKTLYRPGRALHL